jgi:Domain of unknown function (DUF4381)
MNPADLPLRDFHLPAPIGWWPLAPGWWALLSIGISILALSVWLWRRSKRPTVKKLAKRELCRLKIDPALSDTDRIRQLSILIRRICLSTYPRVESARLTGRDWLAFLDKILDERAFSEGPGKVLIDAPYRPDVEVDPEPLFRLCERWIDALPETAGPRTAAK